MPTYLVDKSAFTRRSTRVEVAEAFETLNAGGHIATCGIVDLEMLFSARDAKAYAELADTLDAMPRVPITEEVVGRAREVLAMLATRSQHRGVTLPDLLVAACAEVNGLTVLHYDSDFDRIARFSKQPTKWVVRRGSVA